jgi:hypothetical protein
MKPVIYQENKIKVWKLKELQTKEKYIEILKGKVPRGEIQNVETEWERFFFSSTKYPHFCTTESFSFLACSLLTSFTTIHKRMAI